MLRYFLVLETGSKHKDGTSPLSELLIVSWYLFSKTGFESKALNSKYSLFQILDFSLSDTLESMARLGDENMCPGKALCVTGLGSPERANCTLVREWLIKLDPFP